MDINKLTNQFQQDLNTAHTQAITQNHTAIEPEHMLYAMLQNDNSSVISLLNNINIKVNTLKNGFMII